MAIDLFIKKILIVLFFQACSSNPGKKNFVDIVELYKDMTKPVILKTYTREMVDGINYPLIEVRTNNIVKQSLMLPLTVREDYLNYSSGSGQSLTAGINGDKTNGFGILNIS